MQGLAVQDPKRTSTYHHKFQASGFRRIAGKGYDGVRSARLKPLGSQTGISIPTDVLLKYSRC